MAELIFVRSGYREPWYDLYGNKTENISYVENDIIPNSFKIGGDNYNESIGEINNGKDYPKNERNIYNLYIPYNSLERKEKKNGILLFIHGGGWTTRTKDDVEQFASRYAKQGYITANFEYTLLSDNYTQYNIFRILDEITACIKHIKNELKNQGFDENLLELAIGGVSAGAHITLLYSHLIKTQILPIKFLIDIVGPISLLPEHYLRASVLFQPLESISERSDIENALKEKKLVRIFDNDLILLYLMNMFIGKKYTDEELLELTENGLINSDNEKYKAMLKIVENAFSINFIDGRYPFLCEYCGNDFEVGVAHFSYIKEIYEKQNKTENLTFVYMKYAGHEQYHYENEESIIAMKEMHNQILKYAKKYFSSD